MLVLQFARLARRIVLSYLSEQDKYIHVLQLHIWIRRLSNRRFHSDKREFRVGRINRAEELASGR